ncbi:TPA: DHA2 family efflux MFS transporter permease subunit [Escherichia albertii]|nr:DHA2 family efflux MFS transporter permease subunit [Escherichia albertii]HAX3203593.1 DHA2 family efflux MFS transporter permease subunit [Escherichia albertii]
MSANAETQTPQQPVKKNGKRKRLLLLLTLLFIIIAVATGIYWFLVLRHFEETDDAYVAGNQIQIMSQVSGSVTKVWADNTDFVKEGDVLVTLDPTDARQAFEKAKTALASSVRQTHQLMINSKQLQANIEVQKIALAKAQSDYNRRVPLGNANLIGREELQHARDAVTSAQAQLDVAIQQYNANQAMIQGIVAGPLIPLSQSLLLNNYPPAKRSIALALWSMTVIVAPICGPILGGYISDNYHWGWIFFINVPIGIAVVLMTLQTLRGRETRTERRRIDAVGLALLVIGIGSLQIMLDRGKELDWFSSQEIIILTVVAVVAISFLIVWELTDDNPIVDLSLFKSRNFTIGCLCISLAYMLYFGAIVLLPQLLQEVYGYTATWAGLASAPVGIIPVILSPIIGRFAHKLDMRRLVTFSFIMYAVCFYWRAYTFEPGMDFGASAWPQFIQGFAVACFFMPLTTITLSGLPPERLAAASSLSNFTRTLAGSIGTSITTTMWTNRESLHHAQLTESVNPYNPNAQAMYSQLEGLGMTQQQASGWIAQQITNQGLIISANEIFWMSAGIFLVLLGLVWFAKPPFGAGGGAGGAH